MSVRCPAALDRLLEDIDWSRCSGRDLHRLSMTLINDDLGRAAYQLVTSRFGGGRRLYALAGHKATKVQNSKFNRSWDETLTQQEAEALRLRVIGGELVPIEWWNRNG